MGYSDHSGLIETCIAATALGSEILEFHAVFDRQMFGPDASSSLMIAEIKDLVLAVKNISTALKNPVDKRDNWRFTELKSIFEKSLAVNKDLSAGHILTLEDLETKKPKGYGIDAKRFLEVINKPLKKNMKKWDFITEKNILI